MQRFWNTIYMQWLLAGIPLYKGSNAIEKKKNVSRETFHYDSVQLDYSPLLL